MNELALVIRSIFALLLAYGVFREAGVFTALSMFLAFVGIEALSYIVKRHMEWIKEIEKISKEYLER